MSLYMPLATKISLNPSLSRSVIKAPQLQSVAYTGISADLTELACPHLAEIDFTLLLHRLERVAHYLIAGRFVQIVCNIHY